MHPEHMIRKDPDEHFAIILCKGQNVTRLGGDWAFSTDLCGRNGHSTGSRVSILTSLCRKMGKNDKISFAFEETMEAALQAPTHADYEALITFDPEN